MQQKLLKRETVNMKMEKEYMGGLKRGKKGRDVIIL